MSPDEIAMCAGFSLTLPIGQMLFKWAADHKSPPDVGPPSRSRSVAFPRKS